MARLGLVCPAMSGHLNPMTTLGRELARRGHVVTVLGVADVEARVRATGLDFHRIGADEFPAGRVTADTRKLSRMRGYRAVAFTAGLLRQEAEVHLRDVGRAINALKLDGMLVDQTSAAAGAVALSKDVPFVTVCNALMLDWEPNIPPFITPWAYRKTPMARLRNRVGYTLQCAAAKPTFNLINNYRRQYGLPALTNPQQFSSPLALISQVPQSFDFPRCQLRAHFHYVGPLHDGGRAAVPFPYERLTGQPLIYASMGTLQNGLRHVFRTVAAACQNLDAQLVISLGGGDPASAVDLPGQPLVVPYAPQLDLLRRAALTVTHAGLNTVLESLGCGVPMVALPVTNDQPAVGARLQWCGAGQVVPLSRLTTKRLRSAIERVLAAPSYRQHAQRIQRDIAACHGPSRGADVVERALATRQPVLAEEMPKFTAPARRAA